MNFHDRKVIPPKYIYLFLTIICLILLLLSVIFESRFSVLKSVTSALITPMQTGVNTVGYSIHNTVTETKEKNELIKENKELVQQIEEYKSKIKEYEQEKYELSRLQDLLGLKELYVDYNTVGARVIATDSTNWFYTFIIDKGTESGVKVGCNILAEGGLAGIVIETGKGYSKVRSIIDDSSNISACINGTDSLCTVTGDISTMRDGYIHVNYINKADTIESGAEIVTSHVSNKFIPGILIGYVADVVMDSNNLTQSAKCIPAVDFTNLQEVIIILDTKTTYRTNSKNKNIYDNVNAPDTQVPETDDESTSDDTGSNDSTSDSENNDTTSDSDNSDSGTHDSDSIDNDAGNSDQDDSDSSDDSDIQNNHGESADNDSDNNND